MLLHFLVCDVEHPTVITMSKVCLASDTCDLYFSYIKVNLLLYTCSLDPFEDGILLDTPLVCMHRYCRNATDDEERCKRQGTPTPSAREAWKRRWRKTELRSPQRSDDRCATGRPTTYGHRTTGLRRTFDTWNSSQPKSPADEIYSDWTTDRDWTFDTSQAWTTERHRTTGAMAIE